MLVHKRACVHWSRVRSEDSNVPVRDASPEARFAVARFLVDIAGILLIAFTLNGLLTAGGR